MLELVRGLVPLVSEEVGDSVDVHGIAFRFSELMCDFGMYRDLVSCCWGVIRLQLAVLVFRLLLDVVIRRKSKLPRAPVDTRLVCSLSVRVGTCVVQSYLLYAIIQ